MRPSFLRLWVAGVVTSVSAAAGCGGSSSTIDGGAPSASSSGSGSSGTGGSSGANSGSSGATSGDTSGASSGGSSGATSGGSSGASGSGGSGTSSGAGSGAGGSSGTSSGASSGVGGGSGTSSGAGSGAGGSGSGGSGSGSGGATVACPFDSTLPPQPTLPTSVCTTLMARQAVTGGGVPAETLDTSAIAAALSGCGAGKAVKLVTNGANNAFVTGPLSLPSGVTLWVDAGVTLYGTRNAGTWGGSTPLISVSGSNSGLVGDGVVDGQGGEPPTGGGMSPWEQSIAASPGSASVPPLIQTDASSSKFTMYRITLHNSPKFHVRLSGSGHIVWGTTLLTPSKPTNSVGTALTPHNARNTDGIDPGAGGGAVTNTTIVYNKISVGDDMIAIKGGSAATNITIGHNHFGSGHGMSIGSETNAGVSNINVCDLTIDNSLRPTGSPSVDVNGLRIKSDPSRGGHVNNVNYTEVCVRDVDNPLILNPMYSSATGSLIPTYTNIVIKNFHAMSTSVAQIVTLDGFDSSHISTATLDNVVVDGSATVKAQDATVTLGPGAVSFASSITGTGVTLHNNVSGTSTPIDCSARWVPIQ